MFEHGRAPRAASARLHPPRRHACCDGECLGEEADAAEHCNDAKVLYATSWCQCNCPLRRSKHERLAQPQSLVLTFCRRFLFLPLKAVFALLRFGYYADYSNWHIAAFVFAVAFQVVCYLTLRQHGLPG